MYYYNPQKFHLKSITSIFLIIFAISILIVLPSYSQAAQVENSGDANALQSYANSQLSKLDVDKAELIRLQTSTQVILEPEKSIDTSTDTIRTDISQLNYSKAFIQIELIAQRLTSAIAQLTVIENKQIAQTRTALVAESQVTVPILMYHKTPPDFSAQLESLQSKGYITITMAQLADYFDGIATLPNKPVVITFDDGFSDQMDAFALLQKHNMKATFYLIPGGARSGWCIGIMRHNLNCGDSYLNWQQVHQLHNSGLIEIGAHTLDHSDLPTLSTSEQLDEIGRSKKILEEELNTSITSLAYPYGKFNDTTIALTRQSGFRTAVSTISGTEQSSSNRFALLRVRDALLLP